MLNKFILLINDNLDSFGHHFLEEIKILDLLINLGIILRSTKDNNYLLLYFPIIHNLKKHLFQILGTMQFLTTNNFILIHIPFLHKENNGLPKNSTKHIKTNHNNNFSLHNKWIIQSTT